ncbi:hypothetical protein NZK35_07795 [Stieleria sp. ICT_E10.1]|uniref:hypothetical protein n=1 Tax=Stieleria sedimenti TaxID=2976331 RepID=UPI00217FA935|nr:hypothetical protein [Stieleria sedimenti]MCS7466543.1 hypothetical protein [Stieleria sedimenti]
MNKIGNYEIHSAANLVPMMDLDEMNDLEESISQDGLKEPIVMLDGKVLDGRNRLCACLNVGVEPKFNQLNSDDVPDPVEFVLIKNLIRRHLSKSQLSMIAAEIVKVEAILAKERQIEAGKRGNTSRRRAGCGNSTTTGASETNAELSSETTQDAGIDVQPNSGRARDRAGAVVGVSGTLVHRAAKVAENGCDLLKSAVESGTLDVTKAAKLVDAVPGKRAQEAIVRGGIESVKNAISKHGVETRSVEQTSPRDAKAVVDAKANLISAIEAAIKACAAYDNALPNPGARARLIGDLTGCKRKVWTQRTRQVIVPAGVELPERYFDNVGEEVPESLYPVWRAKSEIASIIQDFNDIALRLQVLHKELDRESFSALSLAVNELVEDVDALTPARVVGDDWINNEGY